MIGAIIRRVAVDVWDNAIVLFGLNICGFCLLAVGHYGVSWISALPDILAIMASVLATAVLLGAMSAVAGLVDQIASRSDINWRALMPDWRFCLLTAPLVLGLMTISAALISSLPGGGALDVATTMLGLWAGLFALQVVVLVPAFAFDSTCTVSDRLIWMLTIQMRLPWQLSVAIVLSVLAILLTVGLLPGIAGVSYLFLRTGRMFCKAADPQRSVPFASDDEIASLVAEELRPLRSRSARNLLQPWRASE